jgi:hypothetical protein
VLPKIRNQNLPNTSRNCCTFTLTYSVQPFVNFCPLSPTFPVGVSPQNVRHFPAIGELQANALQDTASECENVPFITRPISGICVVQEDDFCKVSTDSSSQGKMGGGRVPSAIQPHSVSSSCDGPTSCIGAQITHVKLRRRSLQIVSRHPV